MPVTLRARTNARAAAAGIRARDQAALQTTPIWIAVAAMTGSR
jgi:hypothetical protein